MFVVVVILVPVIMVGGGWRSVNHIGIRWWSVVVGLWMWEIDEGRWLLLLQFCQRGWLMVVRAG